MKHSIN